MIKLFKYLKSSIFSVLIIVVLLICQANLDLSLPDYTSKIINIGIGQSGIEDSVIEVVTKDTLKDLEMFLNDSEKDIVYSHYNLLERSNANIEKYPLLNSKDIYIYNGKDRKEINNVLEHAFALSYVSNMLTNNPDSFGITIPNGMSFIDMLEVMDESSRNEVIFKLNDKVNEMPSTILQSSAIEFIKAEYVKIGLNLDEMQTNYILISGAKAFAVSSLSTT